MPEKPPPPRRPPPPRPAEGSAGGIEIALSYVGALVLGMLVGAIIACGILWTSRG